MNLETKEILVSSGYHLVTHIESAEAKTALEILLSDEAALYTSASIKDDYSIELTKTSIICPYCGHAKVLESEPDILERHVEKLKWLADEQCCIYDQSVEGTLFFRRSDTTVSTCPECGHRSYSKGEALTFSLIRQNGKAIIRCAVKDFVRSLSVMQHRKTNLCFDFDLCEQLEFNFRRGTVCFRLVRENGEVVGTTDITNSPHALKKCELFEWFAKVEELRRDMVEMFEQMAHAKLAFQAAEVTLKDLLFFTRFIGYDREFYNAIPCNKDTLALDGSFAYLKRIHTSKLATEYLRSFSFAHLKSVRKQIYMRTELLFYLPECEALFSAIGDVNVFLSVLNCEYALNILITLHYHPGAMDYLRDYCKIKGAGVLGKRLRSCHGEWRRLRADMLYYCSLGTYGRSEEQRKWKYRKKSFVRIAEEIYSMPTTLQKKWCTSGKVFGYVFRALENTSECYEVGTKLKNCLIHRECFKPTVVSVERGGKTVAAIEVDDGRIIQAYSHNNSSIADVYGLTYVICEWAKQNELVFVPEHIV